MFKWACLALATAAVVGIGWMINDVRLQATEATREINESLPRILASTEKTTETLAEVSKDVALLRDLAGISGGARNESLAGFADSVLDAVEEIDGEIGLTKKVFGSGLKELIPAKEWATAARKEALWLTFRAKSKEELLTRLCRNKFGSAWYLKPADGAPLPLLDWIVANHPEAAELDLSEKYFHDADTVYILRRIGGAPTPVTMTDMLEISRIPGVRKVCFSSVRFEIGAVQWFAKLNNLHEMIIEDGSLTSADLVHLTSPKALKVLNLSGNPLDDSSVVHFKKVAGLEHLILINTHLSSEGKRQLVRVFPDTEITFEAKR
ncbi:MAG: leucine-rich repeat domain-containing protein [Planctomycetales bacterium]